MSIIRDFYTRLETEPGFNQDQLETNDELEITIQQIKMSLFTRKGEVLGEPQFGINTEKYLFEFDIDPTFIKEESTIQINKYVSLARKKDIKVTPATYNDSGEGKKIFVLLIDIPELNNSLSIFYD